MLRKKMFWKMKVNTNEAGRYINQYFEKGYIFVDSNAEKNSDLSDNKLEFEVPLDAYETEIVIYNQAGENVFHCKLKFNNHSFSWTGKDNKNEKVPYGIYFYRIKSRCFQSNDLRIAQ